MSRSALDVESAALLRSSALDGEDTTWAAGKTAAEVWGACGRGDLMLRLAGRMAVPSTPERAAVILAACDCAEIALPRFDMRCPGRGVSEALDTTRQYARGLATIDDVRAAAASVANEADYAYAPAAVYAAAVYAAGGTAAIIVGFAGIGAAAHAAASEAAYECGDYSAGAAMLRRCADIVRKHLPAPPRKQKPT